ncbi:CAAX prenyl protease-like protein [Micromonospora pisi]|uniref:CAAX prenyl protease-like protein n=1 Tax=Micromonospora pisi TaxID=589240 RepID=A0A495JGD1_9ACTN|nr:CPBP family intramembrane glutamic endopeptidase [Micromonospora pisi]RKR87831.1 CAAX prenyl protease-like protein [Micromonospora pisi]
MDRALEVTTHILIVALLAFKLAAVIRGTRYRDRFHQHLNAIPEARGRFYRRFMVTSWAVAALVPVIVLTSADLTAADVGWAWPNGDGLDYLFAAAMVVALGLGGLLARHRMRRGHVYASRARSASIMPRTTHERRLAVAVSLTAGITEEAVYRGLFIAAGVLVYDLPKLLVVVASLLLFVAAHTYQGRLALLGIAYSGSVFTALYLISGSLLLAIVVHVWQDLVALLLIPARSTAAPASAETEPEPAVPQPAQRPVVRAPIPR